MRAQRLVCLLLLAGCGQGETATDAPTPGIDVRAYDVRIRLDPVSLYLSARAGLTVFHTAEANKLNFQLSEAMQIRQIRVNKELVRFERQGYRLRIPLQAGSVRNMQCTAPHARILPVPCRDIPRGSRRLPSVTVRATG